MPKVRALTEDQRQKARWEAQNANFRMQIGALLGLTGQKPTVEALGSLFGLKDCRAVKRVYENPGVMTKEQERRLMILFEKKGLTYDPTLGEGARA